MCSSQPQGTTTGCQPSPSASIVVKIYLFDPHGGKAYNEVNMRTQQKQCVETLGDPGSVKQHHWNTGAKNTDFKITPLENRKTKKEQTHYVIVRGDFLPSLSIPIVERVI